jgi:hypothetical protein
MSYASSISISSVTTALGTAAALSAVALTALQSDTVSRFLVHPDTLHAKRSGEFSWRWHQALDKAALQLRYAQCSGEYDAQVELETTDFVTATNMPDFIQSIIREKPPRILRIGKDTKANEHGSRDYFVWFLHESTVSQVPLLPFVKAWSKHVDQVISSTTFAFVADASTSVASDLIVDLVRRDDSVFIIKQPFWMACLAVIIEKRLLSHESIQATIYSLLRLEGLRASKTCTTILVTIPTSLVPQLLPHVQEAFPDDRHVFCYTGCVHTVKYSMQKKNHATHNARASSRPTFDQVVQWNDRVTYAAPLHHGLYKSSHVMTPFRRALADLSIGDAGVVTSWMTAVDAFLQLQQQNGNTNGYVPYVCKLDFLFDTSTADNKKQQQNSFWSLRSLLQYVTGSQSRELRSEVMDAAMSLVNDSFAATTENSVVSIKQSAAIENAVFQHKLILIENKTLPDTVLPQEHWTLKAAQKKGCSCCAMMEDDDDDDNEESALEQMAALESNGLQVPKQKRTATGGYVDGKNSFAFDPTRFS